MLNSRLAWVAVIVICGVCSEKLEAQARSSELFGGYSIESINPGCGSNYRCGFGAVGDRANFDGWVFSATGYSSKSVGVTAQFSGNYGNTGFAADTNVHRYEYQFGPSYKIQFEHVSAFAHGLFGAVTQGGPGGGGGTPPLSYTKFMWSVGGGLDIKASGHLWIRAAQVDYERHSVPTAEYVSSGYTVTTVPVNGFRYSVGVVARF